MALTLDDLLESMKGSREHFLSHLKGIREDQWDWKPYTECKSIRETVAHLVADDRAALQAMKSGGEPDYSSCEESERDIKKLLGILAESHANLLAYIAERFNRTPLDTEASIYGSKRKLGTGLAYLCSEDFYHAGQVAFIRLATDPEWNYYADIYGG